MKIIFITSMLFLITTINLISQSFGDSRPCQVNVNQSENFRDIVKRATFKVTFVGANGGSCTGTLINRNIEQNQLGFFFMIARHCLIDPFASNGIDETLQHQFFFNYQAPNPTNNLSTPESNRGTGAFQSTSTVSRGISIYTEVQ
jgi:hypothetical protein